ncbi:MAG: hypothetical protein KJ970_10540 [Candidatus Eisenbacteria bacterium]|uniref:N,N-dimethylformamidase beta subunit-like C-terminal domain-containing protein n=1 Tax=Eiseniibacteriota bacterium TaxID=2212470 RepID=A0A948RWQ2_UNCEI|nr:hypothetical protein [Candidatus Eisenbacteria bacterium]
MFFGSCSSSHADILYQQDFSEVNPGTGLPTGWSLGPPIHADYFSAAQDFNVYAAAAPSIRVDVPLRTMQYRIESPWVFLPSMNQDYTVEFSLKILQPDSPFKVMIVYRDAEGQWIDWDTLVSCVGEQMESFRRFRVSFNPHAGPDRGRCWIAFGLPYTKVLREGCFYLDDFIVYEGSGGEEVEFYLVPNTVQAGENVDIHISSALEEATIEVWREEEFPVRVISPRVVNHIAKEVVPDEVWRNGCDWPVSTTISIESEWPSGIYTVKINNRDGTAWDNFVVRGKGGEGKVLVILPTDTGHAYNSWGGGSFYSTPQRPEISFERPQGHGYVGVYHVPIHLIRWLHRNGIGYAVANDSDLHFHPELLYEYPGIIFSWHSEYWTGEMRRNVQAYIGAGGSVLNFSGNTCWWQTRLVESDDPVEPGPCRRLICYKYTAAEDPYQQINPSRVTTHWDEPPLNNPPTRLLGLSWRYGGLVNSSTGSVCPCDYDWLDGYGGYQAFNTDHWVFEGTGVSDEETIGREYAIVGYEVDGAPIEWVDGRPFVLPEGGTPSGFKVLGHSPCLNQYHPDEPGVALMGILDEGTSFIFNGGTTGWCWGLQNDAVIQKITLNLIGHLGARIQTPSPSEILVYPNPSTHNFYIKLFGRSVPSRLHIYTVEGRRIRSMAVPEGECRPGATLWWDGCNDAGYRLPSGTYYLRGERGGAIPLVNLR